MINIDDSDEAACEDCWEEGDFTSEHPYSSRLVTLPFRPITAAVGAPLGLIKGLYNGSVSGIEKTRNIAFGSIKTEDSYSSANALSSTLKSAVLVPAGVAGVALGATVGGVAGAVEGTTRGTISGFMYPDKL